MALTVGPQMMQQAPGARERTLNPIDEERQAVRADGGKRQLKRQPLEFGTKYDGWQKPAETNGPYSPRESQIGNLSRFEVWRHGRVRKIKMVSSTRAT